MMKDLYLSFKQSIWSSLVFGIVSIVIGLICLLSPESKVESIVFWICALVFVTGLLYLLKAIVAKTKKSRIISALAGLLLVVLAAAGLLNKELLGRYIGTLPGFVLILSGIASAVRTLSLVLKDRKAIAGLLPAAVVVILGLILLLHPGFSAKVYGILTGLALIVNGVSGILEFLQYRKAGRS